MNQRDLRFRVFNVLTQEYDRELVPSANIDADGYFFFIPATEQAIVEQSTGLPDMNGKLIFENDVVEYRVGGAAAKSDLGAVKMYGHYWGVKKEFGFSLLQDVKVVGTIHDKEHKHLA